MIAELFYPKELKEIIADLRAKGDLNELALEKVNSQSVFIRGIFITFAFLWFLFCWLIFVDFFWLFVHPTFILIIIAFIPNINRFVLPYSEGRKVEGTIDSCCFDRFAIDSAYGWSIRYSYDVEGKKYLGRMSGLQPHDFLNKPIKEGDKIFIFYTIRNHSVSVPYLPLKYKQYCLSKSQALENS